MGAIACCFWWFLLGLLVGWLLNWLFRAWFCKSDDGRDARHVASASPLNTATKTASASPAAGASHSAQGLMGAAGAGASSGAGAGAQLVSAVPAGVDLVAAAAAGFHVRGTDDLAIIEGIGPKIRALFNENGVITFEQVSKMSVAEMKAILDKGGSRFKLANPGSWAQQAGLAHRNEWAQLKRLQDELDAGVAHT